MRARISGVERACRIILLIYATAVCLLQWWDGLILLALLVPRVLKSTRLTFTHGDTKVNCSSSVRCNAEKLSSETSVNTTSPVAVL